MAKSDQLTISNIMRLALLNIFHLLSFLSYRDKTIWIFGSWNGNVFLDNPKYLFLASQRLSPGIKPIWVSNNISIVQSLRKKGFKAYNTWQFQAILYALRAKYYFIDHAPLHGDSLFSPTNLWLSGGAKIIQLWHGLPLKRLDTAPVSKPSKVAGFLSAFSSLSLFNLRINYFVVTSSVSFRQIMAQAFEIPQNRVLLSGHPRNIFYRIPQEIGFSLQSNVNYRISRLKAEGKSLVFYIPTFRDRGGNPFDDAFNLKRLKEFLDEKGSILVVKFHEVDRASRRNYGDNIVLLPSGCDIYEILRFCDVLVTDYSSIFFDFLSFNKPIVFYPYDLSTYESSRFFYFDYKKFVPGPIAYSFNELLGLLTQALTEGADVYKKKREMLCSSSFEYSSIRLNNMLVDY